MVKAGSLVVEALLKTNRFTSSLDSMRRDIDKTAVKTKDFNSILKNTEGVTTAIGGGLIAMGLAAGSAIGGLIIGSSTFKAKWAEVGASVTETSEDLGMKFEPAIKKAGDLIMWILGLMRDDDYFSTSPFSAWQNMFVGGFDELDKRMLGIKTGMEELWELGFPTAPVTELFNDHEGKGTMEDAPYTLDDIYTKEEGSTPKQAPGNFTMGGPLAAPNQTVRVHKLVIDNFKINDDGGLLI